MASGGRKRKEYEGSAYHQRFSFGPAAKKGEGTLTLCAGPVEKNPSARGGGLDFEEEVEKEPWCLSPDELETWYLADDKKTQNRTELFTTDCLSVIESVLKGIRESTSHSDTLGFTNTDVRGGSFGKDTMVKDLSDVDLVLFVNNPQLQPITETGNLEEYKRALPSIISHLELNVGGVRDIQPDLRHDKHLVNFKIKVRGRLVEFNLLPTTEENVRHFQHTNRNKFLSMLDVGHETRAFFSASFVEHQVRFVKDQPDPVKELIRLVKYWASRFLFKFLQKSYPLELITIYRWEKAGKPNPLDKAKGLKSVLKVLANLDSLCVYWNHMPGVDDNLNKTIIERLDMKRPIILDPANPTNNVGGLYQTDAGGLYWQDAGGFYRQDAGGLYQQDGGTVYLLKHKEVIKYNATTTLQTALLRDVRAW